MLNFDPKINSQNNDLLLEIVNNSQNNINYINENIIIKKKEKINLDEKIQNEKNIFSDFNENDENEKIFKKENEIKLGKKETITCKEKSNAYNEKEKINNKDFSKTFY